MNRLAFETRHKEEVSDQIVAVIASEFAEWLDSVGFVISPKHPRDATESYYIERLGKDWSYEDLARDFVQSKVDANG